MLRPLTTNLSGLRSASIHAFRSVIAFPSSFSSHVNLCVPFHSSVPSVPSIVVFGSVVGGRLHESVLNSVSAALKLRSSLSPSVPISVLIVGSDVISASETASSIEGVSSVHTVTSEALKTPLPSTVSNVILEYSKSHPFTHFIASSNALTKSFVPRIAARADVQCVTDVIDIQSGDTFVRPFYAGNALQTVRSNDSIKFLTVRQTNFEKAKTASDKKATITSLTFNGDAVDQREQWKGDDITKSERPELTAARVVVSGGRGMKSGENFALLEKLADKLKGAVGASRAAVDAGFVPNDYQVGQTGKVVAPELYIAVGISGAIQHLAGMKDSKVIVAINKDSEAPIFQVADYGLVGDLFKVIPELTEKVN